MFAAELSSTRATVALAGASAAELDSAQLVDPVTAAGLARTSSLRCLDPHCDAALLYNNGSAREGALVRRPHWRHPAGSAIDCAASGGIEGTRHQFVKLGILGAAERHELAGADATLQRHRPDGRLRRRNEPA